MLPPSQQRPTPDTERAFRARARAKMFLKDPLITSEQGHALVDVEVVGSDTSISDGPRSSRFVVVDYDPSLDRVAPPARLLKVDGRSHEAGDDQLYEFETADPAQAAQVNAWATAVDVLDMFQQPLALGREIPWAFEGSRLRILPHALQEPNAFYSRRTRALHFGYFPGAGNRTIRTAYSHDIVAHETAHAVLDGLRPLYLEAPHPDVGAFHEFVGDLTAMLSLFRSTRFVEVLKQNVADDPSDFRRLIADLAPEVGREVYGRADRSFLRSATELVRYDQVRDDLEPHRRSQVLSGLVFEVFERVFRIRQQPERTKGVAADLAITAHHLVQLFFRPLDLLPPGAVTFPEYVAILLDLDQRQHPDDRLGYRAVLEEALKRRALTPAGDLLGPQRVDNRHLIERDFAMIRSSRVGAYRFLDANRKLLGIPPEVDMRVISLVDNAREEDYGFRAPRETVLQFVWDSKLDLQALTGRSGLAPLWLRNGGTVVVDERVNLLYYALQHWKGERLEEARRYLGAVLQDDQVDFDPPPGVRGERALSLTSVDGGVRLQQNMVRFHAHRDGRQQGR